MARPAQVAQGRNPAESRDSSEIDTDDEIAAVRQVMVGKVDFLHLYNVACQAHPVFKVYTCSVTVLCSCLCL